MRIIERYVFTSFLTSFALSWLVLSFVLTIGLLVKIVQLIIQGLSMHTIGLFMMVGFPGTLTLTIPIALLVSSLLVFSRLSADSEIAAMRACGVNLLQVIKWPLFFAFLCALLGLYVNNEIVPRSHEVSRNLKSIISVDAGLELLEPGRMIDEFPNYKLFFHRREGNWLHDLLVFDYSHKEGVREIRADKALVTTNELDIVLDMYKVRVDPVEMGQSGVAVADRLRHTIPDAMRKRRVKRKAKDWRFVELRHEIAQLRLNVEGHPPLVRRNMLSGMRTEYHLRLVYAVAALCFVMVGVPLGIRTHRKESTIGMAISLAVALSFYLCVIMMQSLNKVDAARPYVLLWIPVALCGVLATWLIPKNL